MKSFTVLVIAFVYLIGCQARFEDESYSESLKITNQVSEYKFKAKYLLKQNRTSEKNVELLGEFKKIDEETFENHVPITIDKYTTNFIFYIEDIYKELGQIKKVLVDEGEELNTNMYFYEAEKNKAVITVYDLRELLNKKKNETRIKLIGEKKDINFNLRFRSYPEVIFSFVQETDELKPLRKNDALVLGGKSLRPVVFFRLKNQDVADINLKFKNTKKPYKITIQKNSYKLLEKYECSYVHSGQISDYEEIEAVILPVTKGQSAIKNLYLNKKVNDSEVITLKTNETILFGVYIEKKHDIELYGFDKKILNTLEEVEIVKSCKDLCQGRDKYQEKIIEHEWVGLARVITWINEDMNISYSYSDDTSQSLEEPLKSNFYSTPYSETYSKITKVPLTISKKILKEKNGCYNPPPPERLCDRIGRMCPH